MKCLYCSKEIKDDAVFCGFCGKQISQKPLEEASPASLIAEVKSEVSNETEVSEETSNPEKSKIVSTESADEALKKKSKTKPKKKQIALKVLLVFVVLAFIGGSVLGFLTARGIVSLESLIPNRSFRWTSFSEGQPDVVESEDVTEDQESEKEEKSETSLPTDEEGETEPSTEHTDSSSETTVQEETQQSTGIDPHYIMLNISTMCFVVIDDKAHIWDEATIADVLENAKAMSELSGYGLFDYDCRNK